MKEGLNLKKHEGKFSNWDVFDQSLTICKELKNPLDDYITVNKFLPLKPEVVEKLKSLFEKLSQALDGPLFRSLSGNIENLCQSIDSEDSKRYDTFQLMRISSYSVLPSIQEKIWFAVEEKENVIATAKGLLASSEEIVYGDDFRLWSTYCSVFTKLREDIGGLEKILEVILSEKN